MNNLTSPPPSGLPPDPLGAPRPPRRALDLRPGLIGGIGVGVGGILVALLNWLLPFEPIGPSPVPNLFSPSAATPQPSPQPSVVTVPFQGTPEPSPVAANEFPQRNEGGQSLWRPRPPQQPLVVQPKERQPNQEPEVKYVPVPAMGFSLYPKTKDSSYSTNDTLVIPPIQEEKREVSLPTAPAPLPSTQVEPEATETTPEVSVGEIIDVIAEGPLASRAFPVRPLHYPRIPSDAVRSRLSGLTITCEVEVDAAGRAQSACFGEGVENYFLARATETLNSTPWKPAMDSSGEPCADKRKVEFVIKQQ